MSVSSRFRCVAVMFFIVPPLMAQPSGDCAAGRAATSTRDLARAEPLLARCVQGSDAPPEAFLALAGIYQAAQNQDALYRTAAEGLKRFPSEKRFYLTAAAHLGRRREFAEAIRILAEAEQRWPEDTKIRGLLASALLGRGSALLDRGENAGAAADLQRAADLTPSDAEILMNLGRAQHNLARFSAALSTFDRAASVNPNFPLLHFHRGLAHYALGDFDAAIADQNAQLKADPSYAPARLIRGLSFLDQGEDDQAVADLESAARLMLSDATAQYGYARVLSRLGKLEEAEKRLREAMKLNPEDPAPVNSLVSVLLRLKRSDEAGSLSAKAAELAARRRSASSSEIQFERSGAPRK